LKLLTQKGEEVPAFGIKRGIMSRNRTKCGGGGGKMNSKQGTVKNGRKVNKELSDPGFIRFMPLIIHRFLKKQQLWRRALFFGAATTKEALIY
jgi:hypothetical protein